MPRDEYSMIGFLVNLALDFDTCCTKDRASQANLQCCMAYSPRSTRHNSQVLLKKPIL